MTEIYIANNNDFINNILHQYDDEDEEEWVEKVQENLVSKYKLLKKNIENNIVDELDLDLDILSYIPISLQNVLDFFHCEEPIFSIELLLIWFSFLINEISIKTDINIKLKNVEIHYMNNKKIIFKEKNGKSNIPLGIDLLKSKEIFLNQKLKSKPIIEKETEEKPDISFKYNINPVLQYKINKFKNKLKNNKLNKDLKFKINGKEYNFSSNYFDENIINIKKDKKIYTKSNYFEKNKRITDEDIKKQEDIIQNNIIKKQNFWDKYNLGKNKFIQNINDIFQNDPIIDFDKELFYEKYKDKHYSIIYKNILSELDKLEKEYNNFKIIESYYNKLKEDINITSVFKNENNKISKLFTDYENNRINEYKVLLEIGDIFINNKLTKNEAKEINSMNQNSRPSRIIKQSKRVYLLQEFVEIKNIALAGISNWLRDTSDENFEILLSFFNDSNENIHDSEYNIPDIEYFSDDEPLKNNVTRLVFT